MLTLNDYCRTQFGEKLYKLSLNGGMTCPNRDGTCGDRGCIFCSAGGSGEFTPSPLLPLEAQLEEARKRVAGKYRGSRYIAYFQAFTNTYAPVQRLRELYQPILQRPEIAVLDIATRPDCLGSDVLELLAELNRIKPVWIELGLQTSNEAAARYIRRGYTLPVYDRAVSALQALGIHTVTHVILGLPGETEDDMLATVRHVIAAGSSGIKLQQLQILRGTDLETEYEKGRCRALTEDEYFRLLEKCLALLPEDMVVHRMAGDPPKKLLAAPLWCADKKHVLNRIRELTGRTSSRPAPSVQDTEAKKNHLWKEV